MTRPALYDREQVLEQSMRIFWSQGYCATGVAEIGAVTRLKPGSLYGAFESKRKLFAEVLDRYGHENIGKIRKALSETESPLGSIRSFFSAMAIEVAGADASRSCLLVNTMLEVARHDEGIREKVNTYFDQIEAVLRESLQRAQEQGELSKDKNAEELAAFLISSIWGLRVLGATRPGRERAEIVVKQVLSVLD